MSLQRLPPRQVESRTGEKLTVQFMCVDDLPAVDRLLLCIHWALGFHNLKLYFETSPACWQVIYNSQNECVAISADNHFEKDVCPDGTLTNFSFLILIHEDYRGQGLVRHFYQGYNDSNKAMASSTSYSIDRFGPTAFQVFLQRKVGLFSHLVDYQAVERLGRSTPAAPNVSLLFISADNVDRIFDFDRRLCQLNRRAFLRRHCCDRWGPGEGEGKPTMAQAYMALDTRTDKVVGYGALRYGEMDFMMTPVYADTDEIASVLILQLLRCMPRHPIKGVYLPCLAERRVCWQWAKALGMDKLDWETRNCNLSAKPYVDSLQMHKVYCTYEFWPV